MILSDDEEIALTDLLDVLEIDAEQYLVPSRADTWR